jgi:hypothetical protein
MLWRSLVGWRGRGAPKVSAAVPRLNGVATAALVDGASPPLRLGTTTGRPRAERPYPSHLPRSPGSLGCQPTGSRSEQSTLHVNWVVSILRHGRSLVGDRGGSAHGSLHQGCTCAFRGQLGPSSIEMSNDQEPWLHHLVRRWRGLPLPIRIGLSLVAGGVVVFLTLVSYWLWRPLPAPPPELQQITVRYEGVAEYQNSRFVVTDNLTLRFETFSAVVDHLFRSTRLPAPPNPIREDQATTLMDFAITRLEQAGWVYEADIDGKPKLSRKRTIGARIHLFPPVITGAIKWGDANFAFVHLRRLRGHTPWPPP